MKTYQCHKRVEAAKILDIGQQKIVSTDSVETLLKLEGETFALIVSKEYVAKHKPQIGGYFVRYDDGYQSFSPAAAFEAGYTEVPA